MGDENSNTEELENEEVTIKNIVEHLRTKEVNLESPIDLNIAKMIQIELPELEWYNYSVPPKKIKLTNSGHTAILSAKWFEERPFITGGPLIGSYVFSQLHFHWGSNDMEGSEHTVDGTQYPAELHAVHFRSAYVTQESALYENDGVVVLVYFLKLQSQTNPVLEEILDEFANIQVARTSIKLKSIPISYLIPSFENDYFFYWGNIKTSKRSHVVMWIISREPIGVSAEQMDTFRTLYDHDDQGLLRNFRSVENTGKKQVIYANASGNKYSTLLPISLESQIIEIPKSAE